MAEERLLKVLAAAGVASRRASESLIAAGRVTVDGRVARLGDQADPARSRIEVDGRPIEAAQAPLHLALHKPAGVTSTVRDPHAERTVLQLLPTAVLSPGTRLYPVGRLDRDSEGLLLLTNDGEWAERVLHPRYGIEREYAVGLDDWLSNDQRRALDEGIELEEGMASFAHPIRPASAAETQRLVALLDPSAGRLVWYRVVLRQGWKRQVRRMFGGLGVPIRRLVRVRIGPVRLDDLSSGRYRRLRGPEIRALGAGAAGILPAWTPPPRPRDTPARPPRRRTQGGPRAG
jgi:23S rRNA pseudouridine2605 synthase